MTLIVDVGNEMFQFIFSCIISKKTIAIGRNPDDSAGIMYDMITFEVNVTDLVLRDQLEIFTFTGCGNHIGEVSCMIIYPIVSVVVANQFALFNIQTGVSGYFSGRKIISIYSGRSQNHPFIFQQEISGRRRLPCNG